MLENKNIGQSHLEDLCVINKKYLPDFTKYVYIEIYDIEEKPVAKFKVEDWKKNVKKLLKVDDATFDTSGIIEHNWITHLNNNNYFVDFEFDTKKNKSTNKVEVYNRGKLFRKFLLIDWKKNIDLIEIGSDKISEYDHNKFISEVYGRMYAKKRMLVIDKESMKEESVNDNNIYKEKVNSLTNKFIENFSTEYNIDKEETEKLYGISRKYIMDYGMFPHYEEMMIDFINYRNGE